MREITLSKGKVAIVDDEDFERVSQFNWYASQESRNGLKCYAVRRALKGEPDYRPGRKTKIRLHRWILGLPALPTDGMVVDHKNGNSLDCRRENLEIVTQQENMRRVGWNMDRRPREEPFL